MKYLYRAFQLLVSLPVAFISTVATAVTVIIGCTVGNGHFWGIIPASGGLNSWYAYSCCL